MAASIIDSSIFQGIFSSDAMRQVWSDENRTQKYLDIERALAKVQARLGLIPQEACDEIVSHCELDQIDMVRLRQQTERIGYPILGVVTQINQLCRDKLGEFVHWGATTQDITDTATVLQIREALAGAAALDAIAADTRFDTVVAAMVDLQGRLIGKRFHAKFFADGGYAGDKLKDALRRIGKWTIEVIKRSDAAKGFVVLPRRWVVERTLAWLNRNRRLAKDFEQTIASATAWLFIASIHLFAHRIARHCNQAG